MHCNGTELALKRAKMLKIQRAGNGEVVFTVSGQMDRENVAELKTLISSEANGRRIVLELKDLILVDQGVVTFLELCLAKTRSTFEINKMQRGCVTCYMGPAGAVMGQTRFSVGTGLPGD